METSNIPSKAEELFNLMKQLSYGRDTVDMAELRPHFADNPGALYVGIKKLEDHGAVQRIMDVAGRRGSIAQVRLLKGEVSIPKGKPGRRRKTEKNAEDGATPPAPLPEPKPEEIEALRDDGESAAPASVSSRRVVVFVDENQIIFAANEGREFSIADIISKVERRTGLAVERVFVYCSEITERKNLDVVQKIFREDNPVVRFVKVGAQDNAADRRIREDVELWSKMDFVRAIVLATSDGGQDFLDAIRSVQRAKKQLILLKAGGGFNSTLYSLADITIDARAPHPRRPAFDDIVSAAMKGAFDADDTNSHFVYVVACGLKDFFRVGDVSEAYFPYISQHAYLFLREMDIKDFSDYNEYDVREALQALVYSGRALCWRKTSDGKCLFRLPRVYSVLDDLERIVP